MLLSQIGNEQQSAHPSQVFSSNTPRSFNPNYYSQPQKSF